MQPQRCPSLTQPWGAPWDAGFAAPPLLAAPMGSASSECFPCTVSSGALRQLFILLGRRHKKTFRSGRSLSALSCFEQLPHRVGAVAFVGK